MGGVELVSAVIALLILSPLLVWAVEWVGIRVMVKLKQRRPRLEQTEPYDSQDPDA